MLTTPEKDTSRSYFCKLAPAWLALSHTIPIHILTIVVPVLFLSQIYRSLETKDSKCLRPDRAFVDIKLMFFMQGTRDRSDAEGGAGALKERSGVGE